MWYPLAAGIHRDRVGKENVIRDVPLSIFFNNGDSWTSGPKHWDISRCCRCHHFPSPWSHIITKIFETTHATSERYILYCGALSIRATRSAPNDAFQPWGSTGGNETDGNEKRSKEERETRSMRGRIFERPHSLLEISCNFNSCGFWVSRRRKISETPARIVIDELCLTETGISRGYAYIYVCTAVNPDLSAGCIWKFHFDEYP